MSKKGETGIIAVIFLVIVFVILWALWLGSWIAQVGQDTITKLSLTGVEAFFFANLNLMVFIGLVLGIMAYMWFGGGR
jgi:hypothetical protein